MHGAYKKKVIEQRIVEDHVELCSRLCCKLPRNLRYPDDKTQPWVKWSFDEDFVLLAEFSEDEGPRPVLTIPKNGAGTFDVNHFAVHVMSVDYQSQGTRGGPFSLVEDTQVFLTERKEKVYVYVHHFTLYDIQARGFVRPFCMCYISHSKRKVLNCLDQLMEEFSKVSKLFRLGNKIVFRQDLEQKLANIYSLRGKNMFSWCNSRTQKDEDNKNKTKPKEDYEQLLQETRKIVELLKPHMIDSKIICHVQQLESVATKRERSSICSVKQAEGMRVHGLDCGFSLQKSHSLPNLTNCGKSRKHHRQSKFLPSYLHNFNQLRNLYELCEIGAKDGLNRLRTIYKHFSQDEVALSIEATEASLIDPMSSLLTVGKSVVHNFLHKVNLGAIPKQVCNNVYELDHGTSCLHGKLSGSLYSLDSFHSCVEEDIIGSARSSDGELSPFSAAIAFHMELQGGYVSDIEKQSSSSAAESEKRLSDDGSHYSGSFNDFEIIDEKNGRLYLNENPKLLRQTSVNESLNSVYKRKNNLLLCKSFSADNITALLNYERLNSPSEEHAQLVQQSNVLRPFLSREGSPEIIIHNVSHGKDDGSENGGSSQELCRRRWRGDNYNKKPQSAICQDAGLVARSCRRFHSHGRHEKVFLRCYAEEVCGADGKIFAGDILQFRNNYSFGVHLIAALLAGRPMVILADPQNEKNVRTLVSTLWTFVPEKLSHHLSVVPWRTKPLHISDLSCLRIVGLARSKHCNMLPKSVMQYISVLDYETGNIIAPPYKGVFLNSIFNSRSNWSTNASFVAYIHSVFLELASKAYVYYYKFCLRSLRWSDRDGVVSSAKPLQERSLTDTSHVLSRLGVHFSDAKIVQYFAELIKVQQVDQHFSCFQQDQDFYAVDTTVIPEASLPIDLRNSRPPSIIADLSKSQMFKNLKTADM